MPFEEKVELTEVCQECGVELVSLIAPTSHERIKMIAREADGFLYCVSFLWVTGVRSEITTNVGEMIDMLRKVTDIPCVVGFGITTPEQEKKMAAVSDGAIVKIIAQYGEECVPYVFEYVRKNAVEA